MTEIKLAIDIAADISARPEFAKCESPLVLAIVQAALAAHDSAGAQPASAMHQQLLDTLGATNQSDAMRIIAEHHARELRAQPASVARWVMDNPDKLAVLMSGFPKPANQRPGASTGNADPSYTRSDELAGLPEDVLGIAEAHKARETLDHIHDVLVVRRPDLLLEFHELREYIARQGAKDVQQRAELLRLTRRCERAEYKRDAALVANRDCIDHFEQMKAERDELRETVKRLNRRVQVAEAGIAEKVKVSAPGSFGRGLANAAAEMYKAERDALRKAAENYMAAVVCYQENPWDRVNVRQYDAAKKRLRALVTLDDAEQAG